MRAKKITSITIGTMTWTGRTLKDARAEQSADLARLFEDYGSPVVFPVPGELGAVLVIHQDHAGYWDLSFFRPRGTNQTGFALQASGSSGRWSREEACLRARRHLAQLAYVPGGADGSEWLDLGDTDGRKDHARWCEFQRQYEAAKREGKTDPEAHAQACGRPA